MIHPVVFIATGFSILIFGILMILYHKYPVHLIYKSKMGLQDMLDGVGDPLVVITQDFSIKRANRAYVSLVKRSFNDTIGKKCHLLLRGRSTPCTDCLLKQTLESNHSRSIQLSDHPSGNGAISITFSPCNLTGDEGSYVIEHIRDITILEQLKLDLESKNRSLAKTMKTLKAAQQNIKDELRLARTIQQGILPKGAPSIDGLRLAVTYHPITDVGGDIYDFIPFTPDRLGIFVGDASGHGLSAAFIGTISKMLLFHNSKEEMPVNELLNKINEDLIKNIHTGHYLTCFWGIFDLANHTFTFSRAGHPIPVLIKKDGTAVPLKTAGTFLGLLPDLQFEEQSVQFEKGDRIYIFTDGIFEVLETSDNGNELLGYDRFIQLLIECGKQPFGKVMTHIQQQLSKFIYEDDYTLIAIEVTSAAKSKTAS